MRLLFAEEGSISGRTICASVRLTARGSVLHHSAAGCLNDTIRRTPFLATFRFILATLRSHYALSGSFIARKFTCFRLVSSQCCFFLPGADPGAIVGHSKRPATLRISLKVMKQSTLLSLRNLHMTLLPLNRLSLSLPLFCIRSVRYLLHATNLAQPGMMSRSLSAAPGTVHKTTTPQAFISLQTTQPTFILLVFTLPTIISQTIRSLLHCTCFTLPLVIHYITAAKFITDPCRLRSAAKPSSNCFILKPIHILHSFHSLICLHESILRQRWCRGSIS